MKRIARHHRAYGFLADGGPNVEVAPRTAGFRPDDRPARRPCWRTPEMLWNNARRGLLFRTAERLSAQVEGVAPIAATLSQRAVVLDQNDAVTLWDGTALYPDEEVQECRRESGLRREG